jgi:hypothetical protein
MPFSHACTPSYTPKLSVTAAIICCRTFLNLGPSLWVAKATFRKDRRLNIRLSSKDLEAIQQRALAEGLPYQTLIASLLHKYAAGRLKEI